jgi:hypothetical protein
MLLASASMDAKPEPPNRSRNEREDEKPRPSALSAYLPFALGILGAILFLWLIVAIIVSVTSIPHSWYLSR